MFQKKMLFNSVLCSTQCQIQRIFAIVAGDEIVQCVPTKKGHQILFKGYTYVFKTRLQSGAEQWCCSYKQKTVDQLPDWVSIYFNKNGDNEHRCNICECTIFTTEKSLELLEHVKDNHKEVYDLHKENPEATVGFRIEFLHLNVLKDDGDPKTQPVFLEEVCEATTEEVVVPMPSNEETKTNDQQIVLMTKSKKPRTISEKNDNRKRSWVWKYFVRMSTIIFSCTLCNVVLSIKGCNTNNMNRHIRSRHPSIYRAETMKKKDDSYTEHDVRLAEIEAPVAVKIEEIAASDKDSSQDEIYTESSSQRSRRSWIWLYFNRLSATSAQCKLCNRTICHGGNATGNMNRHLKMIHHKTGENHTWVWKVFESVNENFYSCKICQYQCMKFNDLDKSIACILQHLKDEHGVVSGDQIITGTDDMEDEEN